MTDITDLSQMFPSSKELPGNRVKSSTQLIGNDVFGCTSDLLACELQQAVAHLTAGRPGLSIGTPVKAAITSERRS